MRQLDNKDLVKYGIAVLAVCAFVMEWHAIASFVSIVLTAVIPLVLGAAISYVITIPLTFLERHFLPRSTSPAVVALRRPLCLAITIVVLLIVLFFGVYTLVPALMEAVTSIQKNGEAFVESVLTLPAMAPVRGTVREFMSGDFAQSLKKLDLGGIVKSGLGGTVGSLGAQLFTVVSMVMTGFFGIMFSFILLTDMSGAPQRARQAFATYVGKKHMERVSLVARVANASFHNYIVRQCVEAIILGTVGALALFASGFDYALGIGGFMGFCALVPVVGYPVGLFGGALMVVVIDPLCALIYLVCVALVQVLESTFVLPHVGDPRTTLPPVWVTVAVTIGGGIAGFLGMLVAIPTAATIYQLVRIDLSRRAAPSQAPALHVGKAELTEGLVYHDGNGVGEVE